MGLDIVFLVAHIGETGGSAAGRQGLECGLQRKRGVLAGGRFHGPAEVFQGLQVGAVGAVGLRAAQLPLQGVQTQFVLPTQAGGIGGAGVAAREPVALALPQGVAGIGLRPAERGVGGGQVGVEADEVGVGANGFFRGAAGLAAIHARGLRRGYGGKQQRQGGRGQQTGTTRHGGYHWFLPSTFRTGTASGSKSSIKRALMAISGWSGSGPFSVQDGVSL
ncbi:hypothetical protein D9M68_512880 [compost metagenome]